MTGDQQGTRTTGPRLLLCAADAALARAWRAVARGRTGVQARQASVLEVTADAVISPGNSFGWLRRGVDLLYARAWPAVEQRVRSAVLALHGGELPVGEAVVVPTGVARPAWLVSAPVTREPDEPLPPGTVHPYLAARAVFRLWAAGRLDDGRPLRRVIGSIALPAPDDDGGLAADGWARQVAAAWDELFADRNRSAS